jgi:transcriptional regulator with XRE-family HTH domain
MDFAQNLCYLMENKKVSAYKISKDTGISDTLVGYWRRGERLPGAANLLIIADYFDVSVDFLLGRAESSEHSRANYGIENHSDHNHGTIMNQLGDRSDGVYKELLEKFDALDFSDKAKIMSMIAELSDKRKA